MIKKIIRRFFLVLVAVVALVDGYLVFFKNSNQTVSAVDSTENQSSTSQDIQESSSTETSTPESSESSSGLADGTYTGASTQTKWGPVQVQITVSSGQITDINVLSYPDSQQKSIMINEQALPVYQEEALETQGSSINQVSGATETYKGFTGSLQDAINQAEASA
ncbi:FMN-binding domain-containing protein [Streptococcus henryi]|uniref:FMN-binding domain-containing protein n=1 Tax=Streptococcus henryi TaxID=439219 RepID=A0A1G6BIP2_9STRE|nr:FMN-binding protein [Streptococcus henryi]SDB20447.1 FMN-binding domain-containing protein [Streptococcus henryi]